MLERFAQHLNIPLRERNRLLLAAGHAPAYRQRPLDDPDLAAAGTAVRRVLDAQEPYPALALDRRWNLLFANAAAEIFFQNVGAGLLEPPINMMRLGLHPKGFAPRVHKLAQVHGFLLPRLARQAAHTGDPELVALHEESRHYADDTDPVYLDAADVALTIQLRHGATDLCLFSTVMTFGAAFDVTLDEIVVESYFPADAATAHYLRALATRAT
jgi:hypothetical protein